MVSLKIIILFISAAIAIPFAKRDVTGLVADIASVASTFNTVVSSTNKFANDGSVANGISIYVDVAFFKNAVRTQKIPSHENTNLTSTDHSPHFWLQLSRPTFRGRCQGSSWRYPCRCPLSRHRSRGLEESRAQLRRKEGQGSCSYTSSWIEDRYGSECCCATRQGPYR